MNMEFKRMQFYLFFLLFLAFFNSISEVFAQSGPVGGGIPLSVNQPGGEDIGPNDNANFFSGTGNNLFYGGMLSGFF